MFPFIISVLSFFSFSIFPLSFLRLEAAAHIQLKPMADGPSFSHEKRGPSAIGLMDVRSAVSSQQRRTTSVVTRHVSWVQSAGINRRRALFDHLR